MEVITFPFSQSHLGTEKILVAIDTQIFLGASELDYIKFSLSPEKAIHESSNTKSALMKILHGQFVDNLKMVMPKQVLLELLSRNKKQRSLEILKDNLILLEPDRRFTYEKFQNFASAFASIISDRGCDLKDVIIFLSASFSNCSLIVSEDKDMINIRKFLCSKDCLSEEIKDTFIEKYNLVSSEAAQNTRLDFISLLFDNVIRNAPLILKPNELPMKIAPMLRNLREIFFLLNILNNFGTSEKTISKIMDIFPLSLEAFLTSSPYDSLVEIIEDWTINKTKVLYHLVNHNSIHHWLVDPEFQEEISEVESLLIDILLGDVFDDDKISGIFGHLSKVRLEIRLECNNCGRNNIIWLKYAVSIKSSDGRMLDHQFTSNDTCKRCEIGIKLEKHVLENPEGIYDTEYFKEDKNVRILEEESFQDYMKRANMFS
ncbi:MAG: hypothetical protein KAU62_03505 [Candidatus Heimdallarchaeota archaeon]|nr:hypothetical protein [Candidatus Heimdallarchaeota archaeon]MCK4610204.1 hypothetical protein [Candidatus Heimdallarchaeota archaeon]